MVNVSIDVTDLGGEARPGDKVVFWRPRMGGSASHAGRVISTAPVTVFLKDGKATVSDVEPGEMSVLLQCRGVESQGPVTVGVPDGTGTVTLRSLIESQFTYAPPIVSAVQEAASNASASERAAIEAQVRSEAAADRADAKVDDAINNGANLIRDEVKQDADRAVSARQAAVQSESNAAASEDAAATSESNAKTSETNAKQSEDSAGDYAAVATTAATEAVDAMESARDAVASIGGSVEEASAHADRAEWFESAIISLLPGLASQLLAEQARSDGWLALYDPGAPDVVVGEAGLAEVPDQLQNLPPLTQAMSAYQPKLVPRAFYGLTGASGGENKSFMKTEAFAELLYRPVYIMAVAMAEPNSQNQFLFDGIDINRFAVGCNSAGMFIYAGTQSGSSPVDSGRSVIVEGEFNSSASTLYIDGVKSQKGSAGASPALGGLTVGDRWNASSTQGQHWRGSWGPVLIYDGIPTEGELSRMRELLEMLAKKGVPPVSDNTPSLPDLDTAAGVALMNEDGTLLYEREPDVLRVPASTVKLMSAFVARRTITDAMLDDEVVATTTGGSLVAGNSYSLRTLFYVSLLPSSNNAAEMIADYVGEILLAGGEGNPRERFMAEMDTVSQTYGWGESKWLTPSGLGLNKTTPRVMADMVRRVAESDPWLLSVANTESFEIPGGVTVRHTLNANRHLLPGWTGGKTGTLLANQECLVGSWVTPSGKKFTGAVLASESGKRYTDMAWLIARSVIAG